MGVKDSGEPASPIKRTPNMKVSLGEIIASCHWSRCCLFPLPRTGSSTSLTGTPCSLSTASIGLCTLWSSSSRERTGLDMQGVSQKCLDPLSLLKERAASVLKSLPRFLLTLCSEFNLRALRFAAKASLSAARLVLIFRKISDSQVVERTGLWTAATYMICRSPDVDYAAHTP